jgi:hypothetical protein
MADQRRLLMAKARGFTISVAKMLEKDRVQTPTGPFGADYNRLREAAAKSFPVLEPLLPPTVRIFQSQAGSMMAASRYSEMDAYCEQIFQLLSDFTD